MHTPIADTPTLTVTRSSLQRQSPSPSPTSFRRYVVPFCRIQTPLFSIRPRAMFFRLRWSHHELPLSEKGEDDVVLLPAFLFLFSFFFFKHVFLLFTPPLCFCNIFVFYCNLDPLLLCFGFAVRL
jgi:hypothetical protein